MQNQKRRWGLLQLGGANKPMLLVLIRHLARKFLSWYCFCASILRFATFNPNPMRTHLTFLLFVLLASFGAASAQNGIYNVTVERLPGTIEQFEELRDRIANTPEGGAAVFLVALKIYSINPALGTQCLIVSVDKTLLEAGTGPDSYKNYKLKIGLLPRIRETLARQKYLPGSYFPGATPTNGYKIGTGPWNFRFSSSLYQGVPAEGAMQLQIPTSGAGSARPIRLSRNDRGVWKVTEFMSILGPITAPAANAGDDL